MNKSLKSQLSNLPNLAGVYFFRDKNGQILYIGKTGSLRKRVQSYFRDSAILLPRLQQMVSQVAKVDFLKTQSEIEALILESNLIKKQLPKYNAALKDDKNFLYVRIRGINGNGREEFPQIDLVRKASDKNARYFGPFTDARAVRKTLDFVRRIFPFRSCGKMAKIPCLLYHIKRCSAPCAGKILKKEYQKTISNISLFFQGKVKKIIYSLKKEMRLVSKEKKYERAAILRDQIYNLEHISKINILQKEIEKAAPNSLKDLIKLLHKYFPTLKLSTNFRIESYDISNISGTLSTGSMIVFVHGEKKQMEYRQFRIKTISGQNDVASMQEVLKRRLKHREWVLPDLILLDGGRGQLLAARRALSASRLNIPYIALAKKEEEIYVPGLSKPISLKQDCPAILLLRAVRDEAHRFAKRYHLKLRSKKMIE